ncbi:MAG: transposase [Synergistaceae bacterium]|nr:transposase [Synergistaceae bacterium]
MLRAIKIRLLPTEEQEVLFWKSAGTARWAYNFYLSEKERVYKEYVKNGNTGKKDITGNEVRKYINNELKKTTHKWLSEIGSNVMKQGVKDAEEAYQRYIKKVSGKPKFKSRRRSKISFYVNYESLKRKQGGFHGEKIGFVKTSKSLPKIGKNEKYSNPRISYDGKFWYLSVGYEVKEIQKSKLNGKSIGIDLGVKDLAILSTGKVYKNINKTKEVRRLEKKLKREQRKASRKLQNNIKSYDKNCRLIWKRPLKECKNISCQNQKIRLVYKRIDDIRTNYLHQTTTAIVKTKPSQIVMETLNIKGMMKNRHLSKAIAAQKLYEFKRQIQYKSELYGIELIEADRFYPSSKTCSCCGYIKRDLKLSDRTYICPECGLVIDRDLNAAINLANYKV